MCRYIEGATREKGAVTLRIPRRGLAQHDGHPSKSRRIPTMGRRALPERYQLLVGFFARLFSFGTSMAPRFRPRERERPGALGGQAPARAVPAPWTMRPGSGDGACPLRTCQADRNRGCTACRFLHPSDWTSVRLDTPLARADVVLRELAAHASEWVRVPVTTAWRGLSLSR